MSRFSLIVAVAALALAALFIPSSEAQQPPAGADAACFGFLRNELAGKDRQPRPNLREASSEYMAPLMEEWMERQLAAGKTRFVSTPMGDGGSVLCAW